MFKLSLFISLSLAMLKSGLLFIALLILWSHESSAEKLKSEPIVTLKQGTLEGFRFKYPDESGRSANIFLGVPYAKSPR
jgi:hypothetical protein